MSKVNSGATPLPSIWTTASLGEFGSWYGGGTPSKANPSYWEGLIPWVSPKDMKTNVITQGEDHISQEAIENSSTRLVPEGAVLLVTRSGILEHTLPVALAGIPVALNQDLKALVPHAGIDSHYTAFALRSHAGRILQSCSKAGTTVASIDFDRLKEFELPLPPTNEQRRIVSKLESLLARSRRAKEALDAIPAMLERFRQSVLAAAFRGDLTADWRAKHPDVEPASKLLERIRAERRRRWEEAELEKMRAKGKTLKDEAWKVKHKEPSTLEHIQPPPLPPGWSWSSIDQLLIEQPCNGMSVAGSDQPPGIPALKLSAMGAEDLNYSERRYLPLNWEDVSDLEIKPGDFFVSRGNGSLSLVGRGTEAKHPPEGVIFPDTMIRLRFASDILSTSWPATIWGADGVRRQIEQRVKTTAGIWKIAQPQLASIALPIPPLAEQIVLVARTKAMLKRISRLEEMLMTLSQRQDDLEKTVLAKAFRGELVPQDPNDEPASVLLERLRAEREASDGSTPKRSRGRRPAA